MTSRSFFISAITVLNLIGVSGAAETNPNCREEIAKVICLVNAPDTLQGTMTRPCLPGGEKFAIYFENLYDQYPPALQKMFCSLEKIFIENDADFSAYSNAQESPTGATNAIIGVRRSLLEGTLDLQTWASWKEQLSFGGKFSTYTPVDTLPMIKTEAYRPGLLYFLITHEFGHLIDIANNLNATENCHEVDGKDYMECDFKPGTWGAISWQTDDTPKSSNEFSHRLDLCFYACDQKYVESSLVSQIYQEFYDKTDFISLYAATQPIEDFAESLAFYVGEEFILKNYSIEIGDGSSFSKTSFDIVSKLHSNLFKSKREFLKNLLQRSDLRYPTKKAK